MEKKGHDAPPYLNTNDCVSVKAHNIVHIIIISVHTYKTRGPWATSLNWLTLANVEIFFPILNMHFISISPSNPKGQLI
jgi:hypothetical protein